MLRRQEFIDDKAGRAFDERRVCGKRKVQASIEIATRASDDHKRDRRDQRRQHRQHWHK